MITGSTLVGQVVCWSSTRASMTTVGQVRQHLDKMATLQKAL
jgi:hypothetical protein